MMTQDELRLRCHRAELRWRCHRAFLSGLLVMGGALNLYQDWRGKEWYRTQLDAIWIDASISVPISLFGLILAWLLYPRPSDR